MHSMTTSIPTPSLVTDLTISATYLLSPFFLVSLSSLQSNQIEQYILISFKYTNYTRIPPWLQPHSQSPPTLLYILPPFISLSLVVTAFSSLNCEVVYSSPLPYPPPFSHLCYPQHLCHSVWGCPADNWHTWLALTLSRPAAFTHFVHLNTRRNDCNHKHHNMTINDRTTSLCILCISSCLIIATSLGVVYILYSPQWFLCLTCHNWHHMTNLIGHVIGPNSQTIDGHYVYKLSSCTPAWPLSQLPLLQASYTDSKSAQTLH
jgi:hypothetical protein